MGCCRCSTSGTIPTVSGPLVPSLQVGTAITPTVQPDDLAIANAPCQCGGLCSIPWWVWALIALALIAAARKRK